MSDLLMVVDGDNLFTRSWYATATSSSMMSAEVDGHEVNTGPMVLFANMLSKQMRRFPPSHLVVCWDAGPSEYRRALSASYKANRKTTSVPRRSREVTQQWLESIGVAQASVPGEEADDLVAAALRLNPEVDAVVISDDKDFMQLVCANTRLVRPSATPEIWDETEVYERYGVPASRMDDYLALVGDSTDGVAGVAGIGPVRARQIISECPRERVPEHHLLRGKAEQWHVAYALVELRSERVALPLGWPDVRYDDERGSASAKLFRRMYDLSEWGMSLPARPTTLGGADADSL